MPFKVQSTRTRKNSIADPLKLMEDRDDVDIVDWQIVQRSRNSLIVIEYEEAFDRDEEVEV